jgi:formylglycine-generating enzyme required for sulfatase activity
MKNLIVSLAIAAFAATAHAQLPAATIDQPFVNSLGMKFVPVPGTNVLFCIHDTRKGDYRKFSEANSGFGDSWKNIGVQGVPASDGEDHPVVMVRWADAKAFCAWLSGKEGRIYRLPTDHEWSMAVGVGKFEKESDSPEKKQRKIADVYPWGTAWPPPAKVGNFADAAARKSFPAWSIVEGYDDGFPTTSPVMSFPPNDLGLYDMAGNVFQWCEDKYDLAHRVLRGSCWFTENAPTFLSSCRAAENPQASSSGIGFRCVIARPNIR